MSNDELRRLIERARAKIAKQHRGYLLDAEAHASGKLALLPRESVISFLRLTVGPET